MCIRDRSGVHPIEVGEHQHVFPGGGHGSLHPVLELADIARPGLGLHVFVDLGIDLVHVLLHLQVAALNEEADEVGDCLLYTSRCV